MTRSRYVFLAIFFACVQAYVGNAQQNQTRFIPSSATLAILASPMDAFQQPSMELYPYEIATTMGKKELGFDPCQIKHLTIVVDGMKNMDNPPQFGMVVEFAEPQSISELSENITGDLEEVEVDGKTFLQSPYDPMGMPSLHQYNDSTIMVGLQPYLLKMMKAKENSSKLNTLITSNHGENHLGFYMTMDPVRDVIKDNLPPVPQVPPMFRNFLELPDLIDSAVATANFAEQGTSLFRINAIDEPEATRMKEILAQGMEMGQQMLMMQLQEGMANEDPDLQDSVQRYVNRVAEYAKKNYMPGTSEDGKSLVYESKGGGGSASIATVGILTGMLLPAVQQVREAARRTDSANRLRQLCLASLNYESAYNHYPENAIYSEDGKPLLSWRVKILPYLGEEALYQQFHLDEPWDSEHNIKLLDQMPELYLSPNSMHRNKTVFLALEGEGTVMYDTNEGMRISKITDGTSNTILFVEADDNMAVEWTKPGDLKFDPDNPLRGLGSLRPAGFNSAFCDGSSRFIENDINPEIMRRLALANDGEIVDY